MEAPLTIVRYLLDPRLESRLILEVWYAILIFQ
jgi:hypothetical protein